MPELYVWRMRRSFSPAGFPRAGPGKAIVCFPVAKRASNGSVSDGERGEERLAATRLIRADQGGGGSRAGAGRGAVFRVSLVARTITRGLSAGALLAGPEWRLGSGREIR